MQPNELAHISWQSFCSLMGTEVWGMSGNADTLAIAIAVSNKLSFVTDPGFCASICETVSG